jgi:hypothetical protein
MTKPKDATEDFGTSVCLSAFRSAGMASGDPSVFQEQRDRYTARLISGTVRGYSIGDMKENIHNVARSVMTDVPECVDKSDAKALAAYRVGVMKLAEALTGESARPVSGKGMEVFTAEAIPVRVVDDIAVRMEEFGLGPEDLERDV